MAKNAATQSEMGTLHSRLARVFQRVLQKYELSLDALDKIDRDNIEEEMLQALLESAEPNPAMLSAVAKFLKDNNVGMDSEAVDELNNIDTRLKERRAARRAAGMRLELVPLVDE